MTTGDSDFALDTPCFGSCSACETACVPGDVNGDDTVNVMDIVNIVNNIIEGAGYYPQAERNFLIGISTRF